MNKNLIIGGSILVVAAVIYFVWKSKKKSPTTAAQTGPQPGGAFTPKVLTEQDYQAIEKVFLSGNPYNTDLAKAIEGQDQDENNPLKNDGTQKNLLTKSQFDNLVLAKIRRLIGERSPWIQDEENRRFEEWRGAVRAGYANSLAQAFAYAVRVATSADNYYTSTATPTPTPAPGGSGTPTDYNSLVAQNLRTLTWGPTNVSYILTAMQAGTNGVRIYFDTNKYLLISQTEARTKGVTI